MKNKKRMSISVFALCALYMLPGCTKTTEEQQKTGGIVVSTLAGSVSFGGYQDGTGTNTRFSDITDLTVGSDGNVYACDGGSNHCIRKITQDGVVTTFAGQKTTSNSHIDGLGPAATFGVMTGIVTDASNNLYVSEFDGYVRKITPSGQVSTLLNSLTNSAITGAFATMGIDRNGRLLISTYASIYGLTGAGVLTKLATSTNSQQQFKDVTADADGNLYVTSTSVVYKISNTGAVAIFAGNATTTGYTDGTGTNALFTNLRELALDASGNIYLRDGNLLMIRKMTTAAVVTTFAGGLNVSNKFVDAPTPLASADVTGGPLACDKDGNIYYAAGTVIRKITFN